MNETEPSWATMNPIDAIQSIYDTMQALEQNHTMAHKREIKLNNQQTDLLHALEEDELTDEEFDAVTNELRVLRVERRDVKNLLVNLSEANRFVKDNQKFMDKCNELAKKMERTTEKITGRKYYLRDGEVLPKVINIENYPHIVNSFLPVEELVQVVNTKVRPISMVDKFHRKWGVQK